MSSVLEPAIDPAGSSRLLTIEEYAALPDDGRPTELVRGEIVEMSRPTPRHGEVCGTTAFHLKRFAVEHDRGRGVTNDAGIITERDPDTLRGADVAFYSYDRVPRGPLPNEYLAVAPEIVFEVKSADDRWTNIYEKIGEYLNAGVLAVVVLDPAELVAHVFTAEAPRKFRADEVLELPEPLADFRIEVGRLFE
jgi:Uma2 family endonuclease